MRDKYGRLWRCIRLYSKPWQFAFLQHSKESKATPWIRSLLQIYCTITSNIPAFLVSVYGVRCICGPGLQVSIRPLDGRDSGRRSRASLQPGARQTLPPTSANTPVAFHIVLWFARYKDDKIKNKCVTLELFPCHNPTSIDSDCHFNFPTVKLSVRSW